MNPSPNSNEQQGDPSWATENWDNPGSVGSLDPASRQYTGANRLEWDWDPAMILAQHPGSGGSNDGSDGDRKNQISAGENLRVQSFIRSRTIVTTRHHKCLHLHLTMALSLCWAGQYLVQVILRSSLFPILDLWDCGSGDSAENVIHIFSVIFVSFTRVEKHDCCLEYNTSSNSMILHRSFYEWAISKYR